MKQYLHMQISVAGTMSPNLLFYFTENKTIYCYSQALMMTGEITQSIINRTFDEDEYTESLDTSTCEKVPYDLFLEILDADGKCPEDEKINVMKRLRNIRLTNII